jgi:ubiquinone/menaquinone biosynthesis C-methylase UbiE
MNQGFLNPEDVIARLHISPGMHVADFGSGSGHTGILLGKAVGEDGRVTAIDIMETALESIQEKAKASGLSNVDTRRGNLEVIGSSGLPDSSQEMVLMANILFQTQNKAGVIQEAKRVLKAGGKLVIIDWAKGAEGFGPPYDFRSAEDEVKNLVESEGLSTLEITKVSSFHHLMIFQKQ